MPRTGEINAFFLDSPAGGLFCVHHQPVSPDACRGQLLVVNPFNEEMNRCRSMLTLQARALAAQGVGTLIVDLYGTGDSAGEHGEARWDIWLENLASALTWLDGQPGVWRGVLGVRLGALLAAQIVAQGTHRNLDLLCWQPVIDGRSYFTQFLRIRLAARMDRPELPRESTASLREALARGESVEIGGYAVNPSLADAIEKAHLNKISLPSGTNGLWLEQASSGADGMSPASLRQVEAWNAAGLLVDVKLFQGPAFWQLHERVLAPHAIEQTAEWIGKRLEKRLVA